MHGSLGPQRTGDPRQSHVLLPDIASLLPEEDLVEHAVVEHPLVLNPDVPNAGCGRDLVQVELAPISLGHEPIEVEREAPPVRQF